MTDDLTVHGAAPYGRLSQVSADNLTEEEFLTLVLGPRRQDDRVRHTQYLVFPPEIDCQKKKSRRGIPSARISLLLTVFVVKV